MTVCLVISKPIPCNACGHRLHRRECRYRIPWWRRLLDLVLLRGWRPKCECSSWDPRREADWDRQHRAARRAAAGKRRRR